jgi:uncharacterized membrane protein YjgN (DUF898 family)
MKNYFNFTLTGKKFFPVWILFLVLFFVPYMTLVFKMKSIQPGSTASLLIFPSLLLLLIVALLLTFYLSKIMIENVAYKEKAIVFNGSFGTYLGKVVLGLFLTFITLGIYGAWFITNMHRFFLNNSSYDSQNLEFKGKGGKLFVILLLTLIIPITIVMIVMVSAMIKNPDLTQVKSTSIYVQLIMMILMIPYMYFVYKWMVNINYKGYHFSWETNFWNSCGKIALEMLLTIVTVGIYFPLAWLHLYKYFAEKTVATADDRKLRMGYDIDPLNDFLLIWGQTLLTIVTLGIYYPWACSKMGSRILGKTYLIENN